MKNIQPTPESGDKKFKTATGVELSMIDGATDTQQATQETLFATEEEKDLIRNFSQGKEGWKEVDFKLRGAVRELDKLERSLGDEANQARIQELRKEIDAFKEEKFSNIRGGRGTKAGPELGAAIKEAQSEDARFVESLKNGEGFIRGGAEAEKAIETLAEKGESPLHEGVPVSPVANQETQPQDPYSKALDDRWTEIEAARKAAGQSTSENLELEPLEQKQEAAHAPHSIVSTETPKIETGPITIDGEFTRVLEEKPKTPEELKQEKLEKIRTKLDVMTGVVKAREGELEKKHSGMLDRIRNAGEMYNKIPKRYKYLFAAGLFASGAGAAAAGSALALGATGIAAGTMRALSGAGLFVAFEKALEHYHEKKTGEERPESVKVRHTIEAGALAIMVGALVPKAFHDLFSGEAVTTAVSHGTPIVAHEAAVATVHPMFTGEKLAELATVKEGQGFWQPIHNQLAALHPDWTQAHLNHETQELLVKNHIINPDGSELYVGKPGMEVVLNSDNTITYSHTGVYTAVPVEEAAPHTAPHVEVAATPETTGVHETMPHEIAPTDPAIVKAADNMAHSFINEHFGTKGFLGFGAQDGMNSIDWKDAQVGFANQPVEKVLAAHPSAFPEDGMRHFGVEDYNATQKMQAGLAQVAKETGVAAHPGEKVGDYIKRAAVETLNKTAERPVMKMPTTFKI